MKSIVIGCLTLLGLCSFNLFAAGFDCSIASTNVEKLICGSDALNKLDERNTELLKQSISESKNPTSLVIDQQNWIKTSRNVCSDERCLIESYNTRNIELEDLLKTGGNSEPTSVPTPASVPTPINAAIPAIAPAPTLTSTTEPVINPTQTQLNAQSTQTEPSKLSNFLMYAEVILLIVIPLLLFAVIDSRYKYSEGCEKARDAPVYALGLLGALSFSMFIYINYSYMNSFLFEVSPQTPLIFLIVLVVGIVVIISLILSMSFTYKYSGHFPIFGLAILAVMCLSIFIFHYISKNLITSIVVGILYLLALRYFVVSALGYILVRNESAIYMPGESREADSFLSYLNPFFYLRYFYREKVEIATLRPFMMRGTHIVHISTASGTREAVFNSSAKADRLKAMLANAQGLRNVNIVDE